MRLLAVPRLSWTVGFLVVGAGLLVVLRPARWRTGIVPAGAPAALHRRSGGADGPTVPPEDGDVAAANAALSAAGAVDRIDKSVDPEPQADRSDRAPCHPVRNPDAVGADETAPPTKADGLIPARVQDGA